MLLHQPQVTPVPPAADAFTVRQVSRLLEVPEGRLRYWSQTGFIRPSIRKEARTLYSFRDLIALRVAKALLDGGLPLRRVRRSLSRLSRDLPGGQRALSDLRIRCEGEEIVVDHREGKFEASTGQLVLDFDVAALQAEAAEVLSLPWVEDEEGEDGEPRSAYDWFRRGCELEREWGGAPADVEGFERARDAYERALQLDPELAAACTNLGSMMAEVGRVDEARDWFDRALQGDPDQPEAHCNLAELSLRSGRHEDAISGYRQVLRLAPDWYEAHYGLARALLKVGGRAQALAHLQRFCTGVDADPEVRDEPEVAHRRERAAGVIERLRAELER